MLFTCHADCSEKKEKKIKAYLTQNAKAKLKQLPHYFSTQNIKLPKTTEPLFHLFCFYLLVAMVKGNVLLVIDPWQ